MRRLCKAHAREKDRAFDLGATAPLDGVLGTYYHVVAWPGRERIVCIEQRAYIAALITKFKDLAAKPKLRPSPVPIAKDIYALTDYKAKGDYHEISAQMIGAFPLGRPLQPA